MKAPISKDAPLSCKIVGNKLIIEIGIRTMAFCTEMEYWDSHVEADTLVTVTDDKVFSEDIVRAMNRESEDGSTALTTFLDDMAYDAINDGSIGVDLVGKEVLEKDPTGKHFWKVKEGS